MNDKNQEVIDFLKTLTRNYSYHFKKFKPDLYEFIFEYTKFLDYQNPSFRGRLTCVVNRQNELVRCKNKNCGKVLDIHDCRPNDGFPQHCSCKCSATDKHTQKLKEQSMFEHFGVRNPGQLETTKEAVRKTATEHKDEIVAKRKATSLKRHGDENYVNVEKIKRTKKERYGNEYYCNVEKAKETNRNKSPEEKQARIDKMQATLKRHKEEDPNFAAEIQRKSVETRKKNNGEDYTGRAKCKKTMQERYGVDNAYQLESTKEKVKADNLEKFGVEFYSSTQECRNKVANTCLERFGNTCYLASDEGKEKVKNTVFEHFGVECSFQADEVKEKIKQTNLEKFGCENPMLNADVRKKAQQKYELHCIEAYGNKSYFGSEAYKQYCMEHFGCENPMQNADVRKRQQQKYEYKNVHFDSAPEIAYYIWLTDNNIQFKYQPDMHFNYVVDNKKHSYFPDFIVEGQLVEFKGDQFFKEDGTMQNPYDHSQDTKYEAKHQCMLANKVKILKSADYEKYLKYVDEKYGKDFLSKCKKHIEE